MVDYKRMAQPIRSRPGSTNFQEEIDAGRFNDSKTVEQWNELNQTLIKHSGIVSTTKTQISQLDRELHKLNVQRDSLVTKRMEADQKRQEIETEFVNNIMVISGRLTKIELEVQDAVATGIWNGKPLNMAKPPKEWIHNEKYIAAIKKILTRIS